MTGRRIVGAFIALFGALGIAGTAYLDWLKNLSPVDMALGRLFTKDPASLADLTSSYWGSIALPLGAVGLIGLVGAVAHSRFVLWIAFVVGLATLFLFTVQTYAAASTAGLNPGLGDFKVGTWLTLTGLVAIAFGIGIMGKPHQPEEDPLWADDAEFMESVTDGADLGRR